MTGASSWRARVGARAFGVAAGLLLDRALGEPPTAWHPVVWFGSAMTRLERSLYADSRARGVAHAAVGVGLGVGAGTALTLIARGAARMARGSDRSADLLATASATAVAVAVASAGRMLRSSAAAIETQLLADDLPAARAALPALVGRDPSSLDASGVSAAVVESLAENTVDAVLAPAVWGLALGAPGVLAHRAVNTMDAMVGHRSPRYARYGTAAARLDDALAWPAARLLAALVAVLNPTRAGQVLRLVRRDAGAHPSPNGGVAETAVAAALGVELGGPVHYGERREDRPRLGDGPRPVPADVARARALVDGAELAVVGLGLATWWLTRPARRSAR